MIPFSSSCHSKTNFCMPNMFVLLSLYYIFLIFHHHSNNFSAVTCCLTAFRYLFASFWVNSLLVVGSSSYRAGVGVLRGSWYGALLISQGIVWPFVLPNQSFKHPFRCLLMCYHVIWAFQNPFELPVDHRISNPIVCCCQKFSASPILEALHPCSSFAYWFTQLGGCALLDWHLYCWYCLGQGENCFIKWRMFRRESVHGRRNIYPTLPITIV